MGCTVLYVSMWMWMYGLYICNAERRRARGNERVLLRPCTSSSPRQTVLFPCWVLGLGAGQGQDARPCKTPRRRVHDTINGRRFPRPETGRDSLDPGWGVRRRVAGESIGRTGSRCLRGAVHVETVETGNALRRAVVMASKTPSTPRTVWYRAVLYNPLDR